MDVVVLSLVSGLAIDTLLMVNNYRDREQDAVSGKCTLVVRYGKKFGENMYLALASPRAALLLVCLHGQADSAGIYLGSLRLSLYARTDVAQNDTDR